MNELIIVENINKDKEKILDFFRKNNYFAIEQHIDFPIKSKNGDIIFAYSFNKEEKIVFFCRLIRYKKGLLKYIRIIFGPAYGDIKFAKYYFYELIKYFHKKYYYIIWEPIFYDTNDFYLILSELQKGFRLINSSKKGDQFATLVIDLNENIDSIFRSFSKGHKSGIKKSIREGLSVIKASENSQILQFYKIYSKMVHYRGFHSNENETFFLKIFDFFKKYKLGDFFLVINAAQQILGGVCITYQGKYARYYKGAANPGVQIPLLHLAIFEAIKNAKGNGMIMFDLWGIDVYAKEGSQTYGINRFKKGFSKKILFFPYKVHVPSFKGSFRFTKIFFSLLRIIRKS